MSIAAIQIALDLQEFFKGQHDLRGNTTRSSERKMAHSERVSESSFEKPSENL